MNSGKGGGCKLVDRNTGRGVVESLELATTFWRRFCGWQFRLPPPAGSGLLIAPCNSIHTCWMRFSIDVAFFNSQGTVIEVVTKVPPWRMVWPVHGAVGVIETLSGDSPIAVGTQLRLRGAASAVPRWLSALASSAVEISATDFD